MSTRIRDAVRYNEVMRRSLASHILTDPSRRIFFESLTDERGYLVGGAVRDALSGRRSPDSDFVVEGSVRGIASRISRQVSGRMIRIGRHGLVRIALRSGGFLDITKLRGRSIQDDLGARDFTINAMAWSPQTGLIDQHGGMPDLTSRVIRMVSEENLEADPARILRAFRHAAELGFEIEARTRAALSRLSPLLLHVKSERITLDFIRILNAKQGVTTLKMMAKLGALDKILYSYSNELRGLFQFLNQLTHKYDENALKVRRLGMYIPEHGLTYRGLLLLEGLLISSPAGHALTLSTSLQNRIKRLQRGRAVLLSAEGPAGGAAANRLYDVFRSAGEAAADLLLQAGCPQYLPILAHYRRSQNIWGLNGEEIMRLTGLGEGPELGDVIEAARRAVFEGKARSKASAARFIQNRIRRGI